MAKGKAEDQESKAKKLKEMATNGHVGNNDKIARTSKYAAGFMLKMKFPNFDKSPICSIDVHPDGTRFAAGGMGEDCGRIVVWRVNALRVDKADVRVICQMDNHTGCANCVRWSNKGLYLASGGVDCFVMIWQQTRVKDSENWRCIHTLRKHTGDVFGVNWSPNDQYLASCSVDNTVIIWDSLKSFEAIQVLNGHTSLVKGVVWDPIGKYLASQSDDGSLRIWRTSDWKQQHCSVESFDKTDDSTQVLRLDWSTDGMNIVSAHAINGGLPIAQIVERPRDASQEGWKCVNYLAGHSRPVVCVRFNPRMFISPEENMKNAAPYCVCATGSRDHTVCIWSFQHKRPHVFTGLFNDPVMDISWFPDGYSLLACSMDGTVAYIHCGQLVTGIAITKEQQSQALSKLFTKAVMDAATSSGALNTLVETADFLDAQDVERMKGSHERSANDSQDAVVRLPYEGIPLTTQIETKLPDGRRKITPVFIPEVAQTFVVPAPFNDNNRGDDRSQQGNSSQGEGSKAQADKSDLGTVPADYVMGHPKGPSVLDAVLRTLPTKIVKEKAVVPKETGKVDKNRGAENKKRTSEISAANVPDKPAKVPAAKSASASAKEREPLQNGQASAPSKKPSTVAAQKANGMLDRVLKPMPSTSTSHLFEQSQSKNSQRSDLLRRVAPTVSIRRIHVPALVAKMLIPVEVQSPSTSGNHDALSVENDLELTSGSLSKFHIVRYLIGDRVKWIQYLSSPVVIACAHMSVAAAVCKDYSLNIWCSESGSLLSKTQGLTSQGAHLTCSNNSLLIVTADCKVDMWKRKHKYGSWKRSSLGSIDWMLRTIATATEPVSILEVSLTTSDVPVVALSDNRYFVCDLSDNTWMVAHDESVRFGNYLVSSSHIVSGLDINGPLAKIQKTRSGVAIGKQVSPEVSRTLILRHMESQLLLCRILNSSTEYRSWLHCYAQCLVDNSASCSSLLMTLLESLMGPDGNEEEASQSSWEPDVLGMSKRSLLLQILPILGRKTQLEKIYLGFKQRLDFHETRNPFAMDTD